MKKISIFFAALVAVLFSVAETSAQITPPYYNPANVRITGGTINGTTVGETTPANATVSRLKVGASSDLFLTRYAAKQVMISGDGTGATTNAGLIAGYGGVSSYGALWASAVVPSTSNYALQTAGNITTINSTSSTRLSVNDLIGFSLSSSLNTSANPLSVTDTTDSSSTTTGALRTAGGLGVAKKAYFGDTVISISSSGGRVISIQNDTNTNQTQFHANNTNGRYEAGVLTSGHSYAGSITTGAQFHLYANNADTAQITSNGVVVSDGKTLQVGSGSTTSAGLIAGYLGLSGYGAIWSTGVTPSITNYAFQASATTSTVNGSSAVSLAVADSNKLIATSTGMQLIGIITLDKTITTPGTTGAQTINKTTGRVNFAAAATSLVVTNSLVTANSIVHCTVATNDTTMKSAACVPTAGSFTIYGNAAATAETAVAFTVTN